MRIADTDWRYQVRRFRINEPSVVFETFDEEIVAVNLDTGNYYSISKTGPKIWMDAADGFTTEEIVDRISTRYEGERNSIAAEVQSFVERLAAEKLIVERSDVPDRKQVSLDVAADKVAFEGPVIEDYSDMQDLLMLDPIHDVDPAGWPVAKTNP